MEGRTSIAFAFVFFEIAIAAVYSNGFGTTLLYSTNKEVGFLEASRFAKPNVIINTLEDGAAVDFWYEAQLVCWNDGAAEEIKCVKFNGTHAAEKPALTVSKLNSAVGLAIDWYTKKLYWADRDISDAHRIEVYSIESAHRTVLFWTDIDQPRAIAVAPMKGLLFWTDWGDVPKIERAGMNGDPKTRTTIVNQNIFWPNGLTFDYEKEKIYWIDARLHFVDVMDFDGKNRKTIVKDIPDYGYAITAYDSKLYWTDWNTWYLRSWDINLKGQVNKLFRFNAAPLDVKVWNQQRQPPSVHSNPCSENNGNCSHLCLLAPYAPGYTCACSTGVKLMNERQCADSPQAQLILVQKMALSRISLDSPDHTSFVLPLQNIKSAVSVDYDSVNEFIYWTDDEARTISRSHINGSKQSVVIKGDLGNPDGLAVDSVAGNLYWTDPSADTISTSRLDGSSKKVLINENIDHPRGIALAPSLGWMFWSDWSDPPKIERASLDGSNRTLLVAKNIGWPNGIALDIKAQKIYWGDAKMKKIEVCNMDGSDRRVLISDNLNHIFGLSLLGDYLYWTDWQKRTLSRAHKETGNKREVIIEQVHSVMGLKAFELGEVLPLNPCGINNGNCSHFCFNRPNDFICDCPIGLELAKDNNTCVKPAAFLLYARDDKIGRLSIENPNNHVILPVKDIKGLSAITIHAEQGRVYWADSKTHSIGSCTVNGSKTEKVIEWVSVDSLAFDWCGQNLYWIDSSIRIEIAKLDGSYRKTLIWQGLKKAKSIALDPLKGYMYWSEWGLKSIKRAGMDGSNPKVWIDSVARANSLTIDYELGNLIWVSPDDSTIEIANLEGVVVRRKLISSNGEVAHALALYQNRIYWACWITGNIHSANKITGENRTNIYSQLKGIPDMIVYHESSQVGTNRCSINNGGCSHFCLSIPNVTNKYKNGTGYKCACPTHYTLNEDGLSCSGPSEFILYSHRNGIGRFIIGGNDCPDAALSGLKGIKAIEYDSKNKNIYWIDGRTRMIKYMPENGSGNVSVLLSNVDTSADIALDTIGRTLYFSSPETNSINITKLDNSSWVGLIMQGDNMIPKFITVHPIKRLLLWADVSQGNIIKSAMDGSDLEKIIQAPNITSLTLDPFKDTIYWANAKQIHAISLNGKNKRTIWQGGIVTSLAVQNSTLYWIDGEKQFMHLQLDKKDAPALSVPRILHVTDIIAVYKFDIKHICVGGGKCEGVCLANGTCGCVRTLSSQGIVSGCGHPLPCMEYHFSCLSNPSLHITHSSEGSSNKGCIPDTWRCDGINDCENGADEVACETCPIDKFKCLDHKCIAKQLVCDGEPHCSDGYDESQCCNGPNNFKCPTNDNCISAVQLCDHVENCPDGADELPSVCAQKRIQNPPTNFSTLYIFGSLGFVFILIPTLAIFFCWKKLKPLNHFPLDDRAGDPLSPKQNVQVPKVGTTCPSTSTNSRAKKMGSKIMEGMRLSTLNSSSTNSYDRNHITGASSSATNGSSFVGRYPREPLNPPPSPATTAPSSSAASRHRPYRHYRVKNQPPPPTPCSTDVCDESDCTISYPTLGMGMYLEAPPPTPCPTSPPSPSSRSSAYFSPLPPPPSPVPPHYDS